MRKYLSTGHEVDHMQGGLTLVLRKFPVNVQVKANAAKGIKSTRCPSNRHSMEWTLFPGMMIASPAIAKML